MKFLNVLYCCSVFLSLNIGAMEQQPQSTQQIQKKPAEKHIKIKNETEDSLHVVAKYINESYEQSSLIEPKQKIDLPNLVQIESLSIVKYGKWAQYSNRSYFTFGLIGPYNVMQDPIVRDLMLSKNSVEITVKSSGKEIAASLISNERLQKIASLMSPYSFEIKMAEAATKIEKETFLFDFFPRVKRAFRADEPIHERYFLGLPKDANEHSVQKAYERTREQWLQEIEKAQDPAIIKLAQDALKFVEAAYQSLVKGKPFTSDFKNLVYFEDRSPTSYFFEQGLIPEALFEDWVEVDGTD